ncbi:VWFA-related protein [Granulicella arctica]|uniref:VWFA-related protein n=2 Tax=Granulicella arctica TaxID=940613 RepID=A0A7Y9PG24_9BACT|nr:VWA domain-containing protein [Granulicella arctica]NYF79234.1 VWFA-related protein [Granulicella arctica]
MMLGQQQAPQGVAQQDVAQQAIPDAPKPQSVPLGPVTPGIGTTPSSTGATSTTPQDQDAPGTSLPSSSAKPAAHEDDDGPPPELPAAGEGTKAFTLAVQVNFVQVPFTVKDKKGQLVPGLTWRDVRIYENGLRQRMQLFTVDPFPLSVALVIDQSMTFDEMTKVNNALDALQGAFAAYDEVAVFTYNNGPQQQTDFTGGQSARLNAVLDRSKAVGREPLMPLGGPLSQTTNINNQNFDPNTAPVRNHQGIELNAPREVHTLNDAILAAAQATTKAGPGRRRIVYVIGDGKEYGSTAKSKDVIRYLQTNKVAVYGTLIGDFKIPGTGFIDRIHLPFQMRDDILPLYAGATGGQIDAEYRTPGIARSFQKIAEEVRTQYTVGYYSHEPFVDGKYRKLEVKVLRPNLTVIAKEGYYPTAGDQRPRVIQAQ